MTLEASTIADPIALALAWSGGLAGVAGAVRRSKSVGKGFFHVAAGVALLLSLFGFAVEVAGGGLGTLLLGLGLVSGRWNLIPWVAGLLAGIILVSQAATLTGSMTSWTAAVTLGAVSGEMMLGHWYLVDPKLPRAMLRRLAYIGLVGLASDSVLIMIAGLPSGAAPWAYWGLVAISIVMMGAVLAALRYPAYSGVMAATGLSYLAVLTSLGATFAGRALSAGLGPFAT